MAEEGFGPYHVPQQSRRDKLRVVAQAGQTQTQTQAHPCVVDPSPLLPLYDPSLISSDLLTCATGQAFQPQHNHHNNSSTSCKPGSNNSNNNSVKDEAGPNNLIGFVGGSSSSSSAYNSLDNPVQLNPSSIHHHDINSANHPFLYATIDTLRDLAHSFSPHESNAANNGNNGQGLSLSLSSGGATNHNHPTAIPLELNLQRYGSTIYSDKPASGSGGGYLTSPVPLGPFTGYASILKGSRFLKPAQQLLEELCDVGRAICADKIGGDSSLMMEPPVECLSGGGVSVDDGCGDGGGEFRRKKSRLITMLDEVCRRYKQYYQQMQAVVASFECVAGLSNAAPYANLALKAMSKHFKCLKNAIADQLQFTNRVYGQVSHKKDEVSRLGTDERVHYSQRAIQSSGYLEHQPVWRPQRGLPERAVTVLRAWLFEHFLHPYPTDTDKLMLAKQTGLSRSQVSNWFINARVRLWKPMVEEIHMLETQQAQRSSQRDERGNVNKLIDQMPLGNSLSSELPSTSTQRLQDAMPKRTRNELPAMSIRSEESLNLYHNLSSHPQVAVGESLGGVSSGVSLTLGLHQNNNGMGLSSSFPVNAAQRFGIGLETNTEGYVMGSFEAQDRHFGRDVYGGQLLHDFVG